VKYLVQLYDAPGIREQLTPELIDQMQSLLGELRQSGELIGVEALADPSQTRTVRFAAGLPAVTDGPYAEAKEHMGGFLLLDVDCENRAVEIAGSWPSAVVTAIEVRPLMSQGTAPQ
jgi:hypothetical protein